MSRTFEQGQDDVAELVKHFANNRAAYHDSNYKEAQARQGLIDPFFSALGWDVRNAQHLAPSYQEVLVEDSLEIAGQKKAPDYVFRVGRERKFFVEAKKPGVDLKSDAAPGYQLRRYAWTAKLPLSLLTDFEELAVYDCRLRPSAADKASVARVNYFVYSEYPDRWRELWDVFSREAVWGGAYDHYAQTSKTKRGTSEVDTEFLKEIEGWREALARNMALRNDRLGIDELNDAVQRTIDRIIFLRMAEDRGIEDYGRLRRLAEGENLYRGLVAQFRQADAKYNSGLFDFSAAGDRVTPGLAVDDKTLKGILGDLYFPQSPYEFSVLPVEVLGNVYEQFLGKVIRLTAGHQAKIEEKPEVKKAGGVYYTPAYIVKYIVQNTVGALVAGKTPQQLKGLRVLDPACGSGSFLLGAYQYLLDYYLNWYSANAPEKHGRAVWAAANGSGSGAPTNLGQAAWRLTPAEKKRILTEHIFGVDIDRQAVEVTKLSLLLAVLETESDESLARQLTLLPEEAKERVLPNLDRNIKCGNSLIGPDYFAGQLMPDDAELRRVNPFDWKAEFPDAMRVGGFDSVIGNPPYIFTRELITDSERLYYSTNYQLSWEKQNTFLLFIQLMMRLLKNSGLGGFIVPNSWLTIESARLLRQALTARLARVIDLNYPVFDRVSMEPCIFTLSGEDQPDEVLAARVTSPIEFAAMHPNTISRQQWTGTNHRISIPRSIGIDGMLGKITMTSQTIGGVFDVRTGLQAYEKGKGTPPQTAREVANHTFDRTSREDKNSVRYLQGADVGRYSLKWSGMWMQYGPWLSQPREFAIFSRPRVLIREITSKYPYCLEATFVADDYLNNKSILNVLHTSNDAFALQMLVGILNSRLLSLFYQERAVKGARKIFPKVVIKNLREFPFPKVYNRGTAEELVQAVDRTLDLHKRLAAVQDAGDKQRLQRLIDSTDQQIDALVYELYGLTAEEIVIVEGSAAQG